MHRPPLLLLLFAGTLIGSLAIAQPYIVTDPPPRFDDPIVAGPVAEPPAPHGPEADKLPVPPAPLAEIAPPEPAPGPVAPVVVEAPPVVQTAPRVASTASPCAERPVPGHAGAPPAARGDAAALAAREILSWGVLDDLLAARGDRGLPVPLGAAPPKARATAGLPCAVPLH
jgi:hypothetical protein